MPSSRLRILNPWRGCLQGPNRNLLWIKVMLRRRLSGGTSQAIAGKADQAHIYTLGYNGQQAGEGTGQQLGHTRQRERRGSTDRAGRSKAGERLACRFFIDELLRYGSLRAFTGNRHPGSDIHRM
jgi:hypothetical protein